VKYCFYKFTEIGQSAADQKQLTCSDRHLEFKKNQIWLRNCRRVPSVLLCIKIKWFLLHVSTLTRDIDIATMYVCLSIRPSVCLSVTFRY